MGAAPPIYLDHHATTPVDPRVVEAMAPYWSVDFGNAASHGHVFGWRAEAAVEDARARIAAAIGAREPREIVLTSGATESNNLALKGVLRGARVSRDHVVTVATEHRAVLDPCAALQREGFGVTVLPVDGAGLVAPEAVAAAIGPRTALVSIMAANNEIGVLQPLEAIGRICRERGVLFHSDAAQAAGRVPLDVEATGVDLLSLSAHKLYGPKGVGALYVRSRRPRVRLEPLVHGGGHERGLRAGTLPVPLIVGFARAFELALAEQAAEAERLARLREQLWQRLAEGLPRVHRNGDVAHQLPGTLSVSFDGVEAAAVLPALPDVALSTGSACSSAEPGPSHVLVALGLSPERAAGTIRIGLGRGNDEAQVERAAERIVAAVRAERAARAPAVA
ncbi:MAG TPA: aminotransferase class V-fold PLP-dependent enzyme [Myxococcota bacterium]|jgi:cysteine desulfurase|nr:aminotransferase class V-fold PLP-dependent enzyme [Myxococcota bacterium]